VVRVFPEAWDVDEIDCGLFGVQLVAFAVFSVSHMIWRALLHFLGTVYAYLVVVALGDPGACFVACNVIV
jgi:hypothetical protein